MIKRRIIGSIVLGNIVEYYDFGIYAVYVTMIGELYFPESTPFLRTLAAFTVFAVGFLMRPLGGIIFGHIGDRMGRKKAITISIIGMAFCTISIGLLPAYETMGIYAAILLVLLRLCQGICVGGEGTGSAIFLLEHLNTQPGLLGAVLMASNVVGNLLAQCVALIIEYYFGYNEYSWRFAFVLGGMFGIIAFYMRKHINETKAFRDVKSKKKIEKAPLLTVIGEEPQQLLIAVSVGAIIAALGYSIRAYFNTLFREVLGYSHVTELKLTSFTLIFTIGLMPFLGILSDRVGYYAFLRTVCRLVVLLIIPIYMMITSKIMYLVIPGLMLFSIFAAGVMSPAYPYVIKCFSAENRYSGVAFGLNTGIAIFGGTTPLISRALSEKLPYAPSFYLCGIAVCFLLVAKFTRRSQKTYKI